MTTQRASNGKNRSHRHPKAKQFPPIPAWDDDVYLEDTFASERRPQLAPRKLLRKEDVSIVEVRLRGQQMVWTVECRGEHYETSLRVLKRTVPTAVIDFLVANLHV